MKLRLHPDYIRSIMFGIEDSLVSTTGVVVGVSVGANNRFVVLLAGIVAVAVEAVSMAAGQYISERTVHELRKKSTDNLLIGAALMFFSYLFAGFLPILPLFIFDYPQSAIMSVVFAFIGLFSLGFIKGTVVKRPWRSAIEVLLIGGIACLIGIAAGRLLKNIAGSGF